MTRGVKRLRSDDHIPCLPHELVMENILTRLPSKTVIRLSVVCKLWYNSIIHDPHFISSHFLHSQKNPRLVFNFVNVRNQCGKTCNYLFGLKSDDKRDNSDNGVDFLDRISMFMGDEERRVVGYCNGLVCLSQMRSRIIEVFNPSRGEVLSIIPPALHGYGAVTYSGFGFDSLTKEYKVVLLCYQTVQKKSKCVVFTLGTDSWRLISTDPPYPRTALHYKYGLFCGGNLFWESRDDRNNEILLSFDLHDETFQVIQVPVEGLWKRYLHLLEFKGSLCIARLENTVQCDPDCDHLRRSLCRCENYRKNNSSCNGSNGKVHLYILKDKVKQEWINETFDIPSSLTHPCPYQYNTTTTTTGAISVRIVSFSNWVLLSWYDTERLQLYDLHTKHLKEVKPCCPDGHLIIGKNNPVYYQYKLGYGGYQLNSHIENFFSLETFLPEGAINYKSVNVDSKSMNDAAFIDILSKKRLPGGVLYVSRQPIDNYVF